MTQRLRGVDGIHFTAAGYELIAEKIVGQLAAPAPPAKAQNRPSRRPMAALPSRQDRAIGDENGGGLAARRHGAAFRHQDRFRRQGQAGRRDRCRRAARQRARHRAWRRLYGLRRRVGRADGRAQPAAGATTTTIESKTNFFRASPPGRLRAEAVPLHVGRRTIVVQTTVYSPDGKRAALVTQSQLVIPKERDPAPA